PLSPKQQFYHLSLMNRIIKYALVRARHTRNKKKPRGGAEAFFNLERETRFELATPTLAKLYLTTFKLLLLLIFYIPRAQKIQSYNFKRISSLQNHFAMSKIYNSIQNRQSLVTYIAAHTTRLIKLIRYIIGHNKMLFPIHDTLDPPLLAILHGYEVFLYDKFKSPQLTLGI
ncbi:MAG: hypothetical protein AB2806_01775, partial [Candidatus Thiodiazotropha sp.]